MTNHFVTTIVSIIHNYLWYLCIQLFRFWLQLASVFNKCSFQYL